MSVKEILFWSVIAYSVGALLIVGLCVLPFALVARCIFALIYRKSFEPEAYEA